MATWFRNADYRFPFLWESAGQPEARWHDAGEGPTQYLADTPDGAWAEFLRHEGIDDVADLAGIDRNIWAIEVSSPLRSRRPRLPRSVQTGSLRSYPACQREARRLRRAGARSLLAPSAALVPGAAGGENVRGGLVDAAPRDGQVLVLFGRRPRLRGWVASFRGRPAARLLPLINRL
jgi:hypothetical protein